jgi:adenylate cyclase
VLDAHPTFIDITRRGRSPHVADAVASTGGMGEGARMGQAEERPPAGVEGNAVQAIVDDLVAARYPRDSLAIVARLGPDLVAAGVRVARIAAFVRTLHPEVVGRRLLWVRGVDGATAFDAPAAMASTDEFQRSPPGIVGATGEERRWKLEGTAPLELEVLEQQRATGMTDYLALPLKFLSGEVHAISYLSNAPGGFTDEEVAALRRVTEPLARIAEILAERRVAINLLDAYVGHHAGERILQGSVRRGETERIHCAIWFSDLRGFTTLSAERDPEQTIQILNRLFDCQVPAVEANGGEVLKFIGDGMLAIFQVDGPSSATSVVRSAIAAAKQAFQALDTWNAERATRDEPALQFGLALHLGEVAYGNIGGSGRLDFTCIGAAVNLASRVEGLAGKLGKRLLLTEAAAKVADVRLRCLGAHAVKGVAEAAEVYELAEPWSLPPAAAGERVD